MISVTHLGGKWGQVNIYRSHKVVWKKQPYESTPAPIANNLISRVNTKPGILHPIQPNVEVIHRRSWVPRLTKP
jgi:hypothetical protein